MSTEFTKHSDLGLRKFRSSKLAVSQGAGFFPLFFLARPKKAVTEKTSVGKRTMRMSRLNRRFCFDRFVAVRHLYTDKVVFELPMHVIQITLTYLCKSLCYNFKFAHPPLRKLLKPPLLFYKSISPTRLSENWHLIGHSPFIEDFFYY